MLIRLAEPLPLDALAYEPASPLTLNRRALASALRSAGRGSAQDLSGARYEHFRVMLEDEEAWEEFADLVQDFVLQTLQTNE